LYHPAGRTDGKQLEFLELYNTHPYDAIDGIGWFAALTRPPTMPTSCSAMRAPMSHPTFLSLPHPILS